MAISDMVLQGHLAAVMECCVLHCKADGQRPYVEPAGKLAAKLVKQSGWPVEVTAIKMREIREKVQQSARLSPDRVMFDHILNSDIARCQPLEWAKTLLAHEAVITPPATTALNFPVKPPY